MLRKHDKAIMNHPYFDGLYHPSVVKYGMVYYCFTKIAGISQYFLLAGLAKNDSQCSSKPQMVKLPTFRPFEWQMLATVPCMVWGYAEKTKSAPNHTWKYSAGLLDPLIKRKENVWSEQCEQACRYTYTALRTFKIQELNVDIV